MSCRRFRLASCASGSLPTYLRQHNWTGHPASRSEVVGLCPLHEETRPSFYVNTRKDVFYCHGCGRRGDLINFVQLSRGLSFRQSLAYLDPQSLAESDSSAVLVQAAAFYRQQLDHCREAMCYLNRRGVHDAVLIRELGIGYAPGGNLRRHLTAQGYCFELLQRVGLINAQGADAFYQRIVFPLRQGERVVNLYGRSIGAAFAHRFLPGSKGGLYAWEKVRHCPAVILVEGLFDYAVLRQAGFRNVTCSLGTHLNADQFHQLCEGRRTVYLTFDVDANQRGQQAAEELARRLGAHGNVQCPRKCKKVRRRACRLLVAPQGTIDDENKGDMVFSTVFPKPFPIREIRMCIPICCTLRRTSQDRFSSPIREGNFTCLRRFGRGIEPRLAPHGNQRPRRGPTVWLLMEVGAMPDTTA